MAGFQIPCPKCGKLLKLPDRSLLGRKGKCPKCRHSFVLEEPDEVQLELVEPAAAQVPTGTSPKWVPDQVGGVVPGYVPTMLPPNMPVPPSVPVQPWGTPPYWPQQYAMPPVPAAYVPSPGYGQPVTPPPFTPPAPVPSPPANNAEANPFADFDETPSPSALPVVDEEPVLRVSRRKPRRKLTSKQLQLVAAVVGGVLLLVTVAVLALQGSLFGKPAKPSSKTVANAREDASDSEWEVPLPVTPTKGEPIELFCMPFGVTAVVHLRPADLWEKASKGEEFRFCLGPLGEFLEKQIQEICKHEPAQIEELTLGLIPGVVGEPLQVCALVRLKEPAQKSDLIKLFKGEYTESGQYPVYVGDQYAYVIKDLKTFAAAPRQKQVEMAESVNRPNAQASGLEAMLKRTDRQRHLVVLFEPSVLEAHTQFILPQELHAFAAQFLDFFSSKQIETVAWSLHVGGEKFHSEILLRNKSAITKTALQQDMKKKLDKLPHELLGAVEKMDPQVIGPRQIIGRFPAMMKVYSMATHPSTGERFAALTTSLPERAAPNLAIGALLTWDESTRTDFSKSKATAPPSKESDVKLPALVADRLKQLKVEIEFSRTPLQEAFKYIGDECKVNIDINGDALKAAGFTKNMPQTVSLGKVTGLEAIAAVLKRYEKEKIPMVLVIDESKKEALITTKEFADKDNLTIFALP